MKFLDLILLCLVSVLLLNATYGYVEVIFSNANDWIPSAFGDEVQWHPGKTFYWGISCILCGLFLCRFAPRPMLMAFIVAAVVVAYRLYPSVSELGFSTTMRQVFYSYETAVSILQLLGLLPVITSLLHWIITPNREHEVIKEESSSNSG